MAKTPRTEARLQSLVRELDPIGASTKTQHNQKKRKKERNGRVGMSCLAW